MRQSPHDYSIRRQLPFLLELRITKGLSRQAIGQAALITIIFTNYNCDIAYHKQHQMLNTISAIFYCLVITCVSCYDFPLYKQCDPKWGKQRLGTSANTICSDGCLMSSAAMALFAIGNTQFNPSTLNRWLTNNGGYEDGDLFVWEAINVWGVNFIGKVRREQIKSYLDKGYFVFPNVNKGGHWVLATGYQGDSIQVMDAFYDRKSYELSEVVEGNTGVYSITKPLESNISLRNVLKKMQQLKSMTKQGHLTEAPAVLLNQ